MREIRCLFVIALACSVAGPADASASDELQLRALGEAYLANVDAFPNCKCSFVVRMGYARTDSEALARGPVRDVTTADGVWVRRNDVERYEIKRDMRKDPPNVVELAGGKPAASVRLPPQAILRDAVSCLSLSGVLGVGAIGQVQTITAPTDYSPWNFAGETGANERSSLGSLIANHLNSGKVKFSLRDGGEVRRGLTRIDIVPTDPNKVGRTFFADEAAGCIPRETWITASGQIRRKVFVTEIKACGHERWFPMRVVVSTPLSDLGGVFVTEWRVTGLEVDRPPSIEDLKVQLPAGTILNVPGDHLDAQFRIKTPRRVAASDIPTLMEAAFSAARNLHEGAIPVSVASQPRGWRPWLVAANVLLIAAVLSYLLWRRAS